MKKYLCLSLGLLMSTPILQCSSAQVSKGAKFTDILTVSNIVQTDGSLALFPLGITSLDEVIKPTKDMERYFYVDSLAVAELSSFGEKDLKKLKVGEKSLGEFLATKLPYKDFDEAKADAWSFDKANTFKRGEIVLVRRSDGSIGYGVICIKFKQVAPEKLLINKYIVQVDSGTKNTPVESIGKKITMASI